MFSPAQSSERLSGPGSLADVGWAGIESGLRAEFTLLQYPFLVLKGPSGIQECP